MYSYIYNESARRACKKIWILSDLQQRNPDYAKECLDVCINDYNRLGADCDMVWYLGDSVEGDNPEHLNAMCDMQEKAFSSLKIPLCYCMGNHDFDYALNNEAAQGKPPFMPFYETVKRHSDWFCTKSYEDIYFKIPLGDFSVYFFSDHIAKDKSWISTQGDIWGDKSAYPYGDEVFNEIRKDIANNKKVITASHYAYFGGNRESATLSRLFPLPDSVKIHFCGHSHIGDYAWGRENAYRRISWVNWHDIPQINVSSAEHIRGKKCRSVILHIYEDDTFGIFFRNHDDGIFSEVYFPSAINYKYNEEKFL